MARTKRGVGVKQWIGWCTVDDCREGPFDSADPIANKNAAYQHTIKAAHVVWFRKEEWDYLTPEGVAKDRGRPTTTAKDVARVQPLSPGSAAIDTSGRGEEGRFGDRSPVAAPAAFSNNNEAE